MTEQELLTNDALSAWLGANHSGKWDSHYGTFDSIEWREGATDIPTEADWTSVQATEEAMLTAIRGRIAGYPSLAEQLDMQYWDSVNGTTTWADAIAAVKAANPKPE